LITLSGLWLFHSHDPIPIKIFVRHRRIFWEGCTGSHSSFHLQLVRDPSLVPKGTSSCRCRIYFEIDAYHVHVHAIRRHWFSASVWVTAHLPFIMGYVLAASTLSRLVLAHDCPDADPHHLGEHYEEGSEAEVSHGLRWFYCGGLGIALISMGVISFCHIHKRLEKARLRKRPRLVIRLCVAIIIICLPTAESLNSLHLISITSALVFFVLCVDLYGISCEGDRFWQGGWCSESKKSCTYSAKCKMGRRRRQELEEALRRGQKVSLADLLKRHSSVSSLESQDSRDEGWHGGHY
jgi:hypothetical protein